MPVRLSHLILLASLAACRDDTPKPHATGSAGSSSMVTDRSRPALDMSRPRAEIEAREQQLIGPARAFEAEPEDPAWATATADQIRASVKGVDVRCRTRQCKVTIVATTADEAVAKTEELRALVKPDGDDPLAQWMPMPPAQHADQKIEAVVYGHFER